MYAAPAEQICPLPPHPPKSAPHTFTTHAATDLNELRSEIASLLGPDGPPTAYAIINDKSELQRKFFNKHEGVHLISFDTSAPAGWGGFDEILEELVMYHCLAETCLFFAGLCLAFLAMYCGLADIELHRNEMLHSAWWRKIRIPFLSAFAALVLGITFTKLALTRAAILAWPWPGPQLVFP